MATSLARRSRPTLAATTASDVRRGLSLFGIQVRLDLSCLFALGLGAWTFADTVLPEAAVGRLAGAYWAAGLAASALLLVSLAVHELAHGAAARRSGLLPHRVALSVFGGVTAFHREPDSPRTEFKIALAGPLASSGVALLGAVVHVALVELAADPLASAVAAIVAVGNLAVVALNLAPALPLDGGHALRAALWRLTGDPDTATRVASSIGRGLGAGLLVLAVVASASGDTAIALWSAMLGLVVFQHASQARARARVRQVSERAAALSRPAA